MININLILIPFVVVVLQILLLFLLIRKRVTLNSLVESLLVLVLVALVFGLCFDLIVDMLILSMFVCVFGFLQQMIAGSIIFQSIIVNLFGIFFICWSFIGNALYGQDDGIFYFGVIYSVGFFLIVLHFLTSLLNLVISFIRRK